MKVGCAPLPHFWAKALDTLDALPIQLVNPTLMDKWQWRAEPVWYSHNFSIPKERAKCKKLWEDTLELTKVGDMLLGDRLWPREDLENWIRRHEGLTWRHRDVLRHKKYSRNTQPKTKGQ